MQINYTKKFVVKNVEQVGDQKAVEAINKEGLGNLKIVLPKETEINEGEELNIKAWKAGN
ncbi:MAG: hypothetical protein BTN85_0527 [Candidatus Methanohalarchaeum thermophilum]|uniref:Uncharacterized protein n=1 Tax=Methanohalarchaeum thermophilum TaxID=1903181 RepID=A0A1Q6DUL6_METT1|nr:MAG: hypothetical protein BTN85_0527 [Candidatus Methanohalarchaeum thermophilum]